MSAFARLSKFYNGHFERRPVRTLIVTNGLLNTIADATAQTFTILRADRPDSLTPSTFAQAYDPLRTLRFCLYGMGMGPVIGRWMRLLEKGIPMKAGASLASGPARAGVGGTPKIAGGTVGSAGGMGQYVQLGKRVAADQIVMAPIGLTLFISSMGIMEGRDLTGIQDKFKDMFVPALIANWKIWPAIQAINFKLMPLPYRVPFQSGMGIIWVLYLSLLNAGDDSKEAAKTK